MDRTLLAGAAIGGVAAIAGGFALQDADIGQQAWVFSRASGLVAFALLSASVVLGLAMSTRAARLLSAGKPVATLHTFLSVVMLVFLAGHAGALLFDGAFTFTPLSLLVPFLSPYAPVAVGLGVIGGWFSAIVAASVRFRKRMGYARWRQLHYLSFAAYVLSLVHGMTAGTDTALLPVKALYLGSAGLVAALLLWRILAPAPRASRAARAAGDRRLA